MMLDLDIMQAATLADVTTCVNHYRIYTPGLLVCVHPQVRLDDDSIFMPGLVAQVNNGRFKQCEARDYHFLAAHLTSFSMFTARTSVPKSNVGEKPSGHLA